MNSPYHMDRICSQCFLMFARTVLVSRSSDQQKPRSSLYASQFSSFFLSFSLSDWSLENMLLSFSTFAVSDINCFVDDVPQPIECFHVGSIKSSLLLHLMLVAGTPLSRYLAYTLRHDAWYFASQENRPKPLICLNILKSPFSTVIFTPPSRLKTRTHYKLSKRPTHF